MSFRPIYEGWNILARLSQKLKRKAYIGALRGEAAEVLEYGQRIEYRVKNANLGEDGSTFTASVVRQVLEIQGVDVADIIDVPLFEPLYQMVAELVHNEGYFRLPRDKDRLGTVERSDLWLIKDQLQRIEKILDHREEVEVMLVQWVLAIVTPIAESVPSLLQTNNQNAQQITFDSKLIDIVPEAAQRVEDIIQLVFHPELEKFDLTLLTQERLKYNLELASGGSAIPGAPTARSITLPTKARVLRTDRLIEEYLQGTGLHHLFEATVPISIPEATRHEHHHIVAGTGHGKTQIIQNLLLHDLKKVEDGEASIVVIDSQSDLIDTIAGLEIFAEGQPLHDRLCIIDPRDVEWPVALNLFDVGMERLQGYDQLERERLINGILELYDFVLGSLLDAGMTQKQSVIFRYLTRLLLFIPNATIHTLRELLEDDGFDKYEDHINKLEGSAKAFFKEEFRGKEFQSTKKQVLRRLYGILENQSFERMFSHPKSKLDLFHEMNAGKVILINTAKDLLKENGTQILGRFFIAMVAQAAQERAVLPKSERKNTIVYVDEAQDYFDRNIGIILSQTRKYSVGLVIAHQFLGQLDGKLQEAVFANTSIKFAGGVSAKDARTLAADFHTDPSMIETQPKLSFAAYVKGATQNAMSISIKYGAMESLPKLTDRQKKAQREAMRRQYAIHYTEAQEAAKRSASDPMAYDETPETSHDEQWWDEDEDGDTKEQPWEKWGDFRDSDLPEHPNDKTKPDKDKDHQ